MLEDGEAENEVLKNYAKATIHLMDEIHRLNFENKMLTMYFWAAESHIKDQENPELLEHYAKQVRHVLQNK